MANTEEFKVNGEDALKAVKRIVAEGNARRIIIKNEAGESLIEFPLTVGAIGAVLLPLWAAVAAIAALVAKCTIVVEKRDPAKPAAPADMPTEPQTAGETPLMPESFDQKPEEKKDTPPGPAEGVH